MWVWTRTYGPRPGDTLPPQPTKLEIKGDTWKTEGRRQMERKAQRGRHRHQSWENSSWGKHIFVNKNTTNKYPVLTDSTPSLNFDSCRAMPKTFALPRRATLRFNSSKPWIKGIKLKPCNGPRIPKKKVASLWSSWGEFLNEHPSHEMASTRFLLGCSLAWLFNCTFEHPTKSLHLVLLSFLDPLPHPEQRQFKICPMSNSNFQIPKKMAYFFVDSLPHPLHLHLLVPITSNRNTETLEV